MKIYLSSTYEDLKDHRRVVFDALRQSSYQVIAMEDYVARDERPVDAVLKDVAEADIYVGIFGLRYGYVPPIEHNNPDGLSITELEFRQADKQPNTYCVTFLLNEDDALPPKKYIDALSGKNEQGARVRRLRDDLQREKTSHFFSYARPYELASLVQRSVAKYTQEHGTSESISTKTKNKRILVPDIDWVTIPAGEFIYGENESRTSLYLDSFEIARYPVTNRQYQCFIDDGGYSNGGYVDENYVEKGYVQEGDGNEQWWLGLEKPEPEQPGWPQGNRPRTNVNWHEATAFTRWLSARLNDHIRLPFEHEWEKAARGENGLAYPWGDDYQTGFANVDESEMKNGVNLEQTTAVGLYPRDESPYQLRDMAGNVRGWCNEFKAEQNEQAPEGESSPVLRGGSWLGHPQFARAASRRYWYDPVSRDNLIGFRLLRSPPS